MGYVLKPDEKEAIIHYVGLFGFISRYSSLANLFSGLSQEEAKARGMEPAYLMRWGWKHYNAVSMPFSSGLSSLRQSRRDGRGDVCMCQCPSRRASHFYPTPPKTLYLCGFQASFLQVFFRIF